MKILQNNQSWQKPRSQLRWLRELRFNLHSLLRVRISSAFRCWLRLT
ncbi:hypothetical protein HanRHA438_Chr14g0673721 [Helianthus annuus]|nr:hypothetical protein HanRHA438_Chr14g0673721 [Helianthus annuus]